MEGEVTVLVHGLMGYESCGSNGLVYGFMGFDALGIGCFLYIRFVNND